MQNKMNTVILKISYLRSYKLIMFSISLFQCVNY